MRVARLVGTLALLVASACLENDSGPPEEGEERSDVAADTNGLAVKQQSLESALCGNTAGLQANAVWPMYGGCPTHAAQSSQYGPPTNGKNWQRGLLGKVSSSPAIAADGSIYIGSEGNWFFKLNPTTGAILKQEPTWGKVKSTPAIGADGTVYVGDDSGTFYAVDPVTIKSKWTVNWIGAVNSSPAIAPDGTIYFGSEDFNLYAYRPNGTKKWSHLTGTPVISSPAVGTDGTVFFGSDITLYALNPSDGTKKWSRIIGFPITSSPAVGRFGRVYIGAGDKLLAYDASNGTPLWERSLGSCTIFAPAIGQNGTIYVGVGFNVTTGGSLYAVSPDGDILWHFDVLGGVKSTPVIDRAGNIYFGANDNNVYAVDGTGAQIWKFPTGDDVRSSPAIAANGAVIVGSDDNNLYSIGVGATRVGNGGVCTSDAQCVPGLVCGLGNGPRFGLAATVRACWVPTCENKVQDPGETEVDCGGACGTCTNVCSLACKVGDQVSPPALEVLPFSKASFVRATVGSYQLGTQKVEVAGGNVLRFEERGDGKGRLALFEGARTNRLRYSEYLTHTPEWRMPTGGTPIVATENFAASPKGDTTAERMVAPAGGNPSRTQTISGAQAAGVLSGWLRLRDTAAAESSTRAVLADSANRWFSNPAAWPVSAAWTRRTMLTTASPGSADLSFSHKSGWPGNAATFPQLGAADFLVWGMQWEDGGFASSYIPSTDAVATRAADRLIFEAADVPAWVRTGIWQIDVAPIFAHTEIAVGDELTLVAWENGALTLGRDAAGGVVKVTSASASATLSADWAKDTRLTVTLDFGAHTLAVRGATRGDGTVGTGTTAIPTGRLSVGAKVDGSRSAYARISELRRVTAATQACTLDPDCVTCGDGQVNGNEACDTAASSTCDSDCAQDFGFPKPCDPAAADPGCGPGQACGLHNGEAFGGSRAESYCYPAAICAHGECGPTSPCGLCVCAPTCSGVACATGPSPVCSATCASTCQDAQEGCQVDLDCPQGSACIASYCRPQRCLERDVRESECGDDAPCGPCLLALTGTKCAVQACGIDEYGNSCGSCDDNSVCISGSCRPKTNAPPAEATALADASTTPAGALRGTFAVDERGNATYSVPLAVPPGRAGFQPSLSLNYNSASGRTHVGDGWSIGGVQTITRCPRTRGDDGYNAPIQFTKDDAFCLNGRRLFLVAEGDVEFPKSYGDIDTEYRTEPDQFIRVFARRTTPVASGYVEPEFFEAKTNTGTTLRFGKSPDARKWVTPQSGTTPRATLVWYLNEIEDARGNVASYIYRQRTIEQVVRSGPGKGSASTSTDPFAPFVDEVMLHSIEYPPFQKVEFHYAPVPWARSQGARYWAGVEANTSERLVDVMTFSGDKPLQQYKLTMNIRNNAWMVDKLEQCALDRAGQSPTNVCLEPIVFTYGSSTTQPIYRHTLTNPGDPPPKSDTRYWQSLAVDMNSDGREDLLYSKFRENRSGLKGYQQLQMVFRLAFADGFGPEAPTNLRADCDDHQVIDFTGSGRPNDVLMTCRFKNPDDPADPMPNDHDSGIYVAIYRGAGAFEHIRVWDVPKTWPVNSLGYGRVMAADLNGDGYKDLVSCTVTYSDRPNDLDNMVLWHYRMRDSTTNGFSPAQEIARLRATFCFDTRNAVLDLDGDGDDEVLIRTTEETLDYFRAPGFRETFGLIAGQPDNAVQFVRDALPKPAIPGLSSPHPVIEFLMAQGAKLDVNGDGLLDAIAFRNDGIDLVLGTGTSFRFHGHAPKPAWFDERDKWGDYDMSDGFVLDQDGDGRDEYFFAVKNRGRYGVIKPLVETMDSGHVVPFSVRLTDIPYKSHGPKWKFPIRISDHLRGSSSIVVRSNDRTGVTFDTITGALRSVNKLYSITSARTRKAFVHYDDDSYTPRPGIVCAPPACMSGSPEPTVANVTYSNGGIGYTSVYSYEDARTDQLRRSYLGFAKVSESVFVGGQTELTSTIEYHNSPFNGGWVEFAGLPKSVERRTLAVDADGTLPVEHVEQTGFTWYTARSDANYRFHYVAGTTSYVYDNGEVSLLAITDSSNVDAFGNVLRTSTSWDDGRVINRETRYEPTGGLPPLARERNLRSLPHYQTVEAMDNGEYTRTATRTTFDYQTGLALARVRLDTDTTPPNRDVALLPTRAYTGFLYHPFGNLKAVLHYASDATPQYYEYEYDPSFTFPTEIRNTVHMEAGLPPTRLWVDSGTGNIRWIRASSGESQTENYDAFGRSRELITSGGVRRDYEYIATGLADSEYMGIRETGTNLPANTTFLYDDDQPSRYSEVRADGLNLNVSAIYDYRRRLRRFSQPRTGNQGPEVWNEIAYDTLDRVIQTVVPTTVDGVATSAVTKFIYFPAALSQSESSIFSLLAPTHTYIQGIQDPDKKNWFALFDRHGNAVGSIDPFGTMTRNTYDGFDRLVGVDVGIPGNTLHTTIRRDSAGQIVHMMDPDRGESDTTYDGLGMAQVRSQNGAGTELDWDGLGRPVSIRTPDGETSYVWDKHASGGIKYSGRLVSTTQTSRADAPVSYRYRYGGPDGEIDLFETQIGTSAYSTSATFEGGLVSEVTWPNGLRSKHMYDAGGHPTEVRDATQLGTAAPLWKALEWDVYGEVSKVRYANGMVVSTVRDPRSGLVASQSATGVTPEIHRSYSYDLRSILRRRTDGTTQDDYVPDANGRLQAHRLSDGGAQAFSTTYGYDSFGNLTGGTKSVGNGAPENWSYTYDPAAHPRAVRTTSDGYSFDYDADGRQWLRTGPGIPDGRQELGYDASGLPTRILSGPEAQPVSQSTVVYGPDHRRVALSIVRNGSSTSTLHYASPFFISKTTGVTTSSMLSIPLPDGSSIQRTDQPLSASTIALTDSMGSIVNLVSGTVNHSISYTPYGASSEGTQRTSRWGFLGQEEDVELGLVNLNARIYDPKLRRFLSPDPIMSDALWGAGSPSSYAYAGNMPNVLSDPTGLDSQQCDGQCLMEPKTVRAQDGVTTMDPVGVSLTHEDDIRSRRDFDVSDTGWSSGWDGAPRSSNDYSISDTPTAALIPYRTREELARGGMYDRSAQSVLYDPRTGPILAETNARWRDAFIRESVTSLIPIGKIASWASRIPFVSKVLLSAVGRAAARGGRLLCFAAGTMVHAEDGLVRIEEVAVGDLVWSKDEQTGKTALRRVAKTFVTPESRLLSVVLEDEDKSAERLRVTGEHPFYTDAGWVAAKDLRPNDRVLQRDGGWLRVGSATWEQRKEAVYNLEVEDFHTYFVGAKGAWVHNNCGKFEWMVQGGGILGEVNPKGVLSFAIEAGEAAAVRGTQLFGAMMAALGPQVRAIQGNWFYGTNLARVNALTAGGMPLQQAVMQTWTASRAGMYGFVNATVQAVEGTAGQFSRVQVLFTR